MNTISLAMGRRKFEQCAFLRQLAQSMWPSLFVFLSHVHLFVYEHSMFSMQPHRSVSLLREGLVFMMLFPMHLNACLSTVGPVYVAQSIRISFACSFVCI